MDLFGCYFVYGILLEWSDDLNIDILGYFVIRFIFVEMMTTRRTPSE